MNPNRKTSLNLETPQDSSTFLLLTVLPLESRSLFLGGKDWHMWRGEYLEYGFVS